MRLLDQGRFRNLNAKQFGRQLQAPDRADHSSGKTGADQLMGTDIHRQRAAPRHQLQLLHGQQTLLQHQLAQSRHQTRGLGHGDQFRGSDRTAL